MLTGCCRKPNNPCHCLRFSNIQLSITKARYFG
jgi:hypothetical protein